MDTLAISRSLRDAELEQPAAEAITSAIRDAVDSSAASKADLEKAVQQLDGKIDRSVERLDAKIDRVAERLEAKIDKSIQALELKMVWWIVGAGGLFALLQVAARFLLP